MSTKFIFRSLISMQLTVPKIYGPIYIEYCTVSKTKIFYSEWLKSWSNSVFRTVPIAMSHIGSVILLSGNVYSILSLFFRTPTIYDTFKNLWQKERGQSIIAIRSRNDYETVSNINVVSTDSFKQLEVAVKSITSQTKLHVYCKYDFGLHALGSYSFVSLNNLDNISISLDEDNDLEEEITHLFNEVSIFISKF